MDFMIWAVRVSHLFAVVVWLGSLLYQAAVILPLWTPGDRTRTEVVRMFLGRSLPYLWMGLTTALITGICLMLFSTRFVFFRYDDWWSIALGLKQVLFLLMAIFTIGLIRLVQAFSELRESDQEDLLRIRILQFNRSSVLLGIMTLLLAASMN